jgi:hypothetical protein
MSFSYVKEKLNVCVRLLMRCGSKSVSQHAR